MGSFKTWIQQESFTDAGIWMGRAIADEVPEDPQVKAKAEQFKQEFQKFQGFVKKYDYLGLARAFQVTAVGYPKVAWDFCSCLFSRLAGKGCDWKKAGVNLLKVIPASILMGTAKFFAPLAFGLEIGGAIALGVQAIQYLYWPFWAWASRNLENPDPNKAKQAQIILAAIPEQFKQMLAVQKQQPPVQEWFNEQMVLLSEYNPVFGELVT